MTAARDDLQRVQRYAAASVLSKSPEYNLRVLQRWYAREFHVPLTQVRAEVPLEVLLLDLYERHYEGLRAKVDTGDHEARRNLCIEVQQLMESPAERCARLNKGGEVDEEEEDWLREERELAAQQQRDLEAAAVAAAARPQAGQVRLADVKASVAELEALQVALDEDGAVLRMPPGIRDD